MKFKLGKHRPKKDDRTLKLRDYLGASLPPPPASVDYYSTVISWPMMGNDTYGDCTAAAAGHMIEQWTTLNGDPRIPSTPQVIEFYDHFSGGDPDAGANMLDVLKYWRSDGLAGDKIDGFTQLDATNQLEVMTAISLFGNSDIGLALPDSVVAEDVDLLAVPWMDASEPPNPQNGHDVVIVGYDAMNAYVATWGALKPMSWQFFGRYCDEAYAVLSKDWIGANTSPSGFDLATLRDDLDLIDASNPDL